MRCMLTSSELLMIAKYYNFECLIFRYKLPLRAKRKIQNNIELQLWSFNIFVCKYKSLA